MVTIGAVVACVVASIAFQDVASAEVSLDVVVSELSFTTVTAQALTENIAAERLGVYGTIADGSSARPGGRRGIAFRPMEGTGPRGTIDVGPLETDANQRVRLGLSSVPATFQIVTTLSAPIEVWTNGRLFVGSSDGVGQPTSYAAPTQTLLRMSGDADLRIAVSEPAALHLALPIPITALQFEHMDAAALVPSPGSTADRGRTVSTLLSGDLYQQSIQGEKHTFAPRQVVDLAVKDGQLTDLRAGTDGWHVHFDGVVTKLSVGSGEAARSLMPSYLDWLLARHRLAVFWTTFGYAVALLIALMTWWRKP